METVVRETLIQHGVEPSDASFDACFNRLSTITETFVRVCLSLTSVHLSDSVNWSSDGTSA